MIRILEVNEGGYPVLKLDAGDATAATPGRAALLAPECRDGRCAGFSPAPLLDGSLLVDPEIHLPSAGMDVDIAYYYNASDTYNGPFGYARTVSPNLRAQASSTTAIVTLTRAQFIHTSENVNFTARIR